jgi:hypothetical protein
MSSGADIGPQQPGVPGAPYEQARDRVDPVLNPSDSLEPARRAQDRLLEPAIVGLKLERALQEARNSLPRIRVIESRLCKADEHADALESHVHPLPGLSVQSSPPGLNLARFSPPLGLIRAQFGH